MSKPHYKWWGYVKAVIRSYPEYRRTLQELKRQIMTVNYGAIGHGSSPGKQTESLALKTLSPVEQKEYDAVEEAISLTRDMPDGVKRMDLVSMVFFKKTHTLSGAAIACNVSYGTAKNWHKHFIMTVADCLELI